jgi:hypothetical protein
MTPKRERRPAGNGPASETAADAPDGTYSRHDEPQRRRAAAVRLPGGDPLFPGTRFHRAPTGFRASGYREGYLAALRYVLRDLEVHPLELVRAKLAAIVSRGGDEA